MPRTLCLPISGTISAIGYVCNQDNLNIKATYLAKTAIKEALNEVEQELESNVAQEIQKADEQTKVTRLSIEKEQWALETEMQVIQTQ